MIEIRIYHDQYANNFLKLDLLKGAATITVNIHIYAFMIISTVLYLMLVAPIRPLYFRHKSGYNLEYHAVQHIAPSITIVPGPRAGPHLAW